MNGTHYIHSVYIALCTTKGSVLNKLNCCFLTPNFAQNLILSVKPVNLEVQL